MSSTVPAIAIQLAPSEQFEITADIVDEIPIKDNDFYRSQYLAPPPVMSPIRGTQAQQRPSNKKGLDKDRFDELLRASRERISSGRKAQDLRKEVALKVHKTKQVERRAMFLSKLDARPTADATMTPVTPPESPAVFHFSLPSPGLVSPLALFETLEKGGLEQRRTGWVEQIDFRAQAQEKKEKAKRRSHARIPSLDEISARMRPTPQLAAQQPTGTTARAPIPLPAFLSSRTTTTVAIPPRKPEVQGPLPPVPTTLKRAPLVIPARRRSPDLAPLSVEVPRVMITSASPVTPTASTTPAPKPATRAPIVISAAVPSPAVPQGRAERANAMVERLRKRISAPAALPAIREQHPILLVRGGF